MSELQKPVQPQPVEKPVEPEEVTEPVKPNLLKYAMRTLWLRRGFLAFWLSIIIGFAIGVGLYFVTVTIVNALNLRFYSLNWLIWLIVFEFTVPIILLMTLFFRLPVKKLNLEKLKSIKFGVTLLICIFILVFAITILLFILYGGLKLFADNPTNFYIFLQLILCIIAASSPFIIYSSIVIAKTKKFRKIAGDATQEQLTAELEAFKANFKTEKRTYKQYLKDYRAYKFALFKAQRQDKKNMRAYNTEMEVYNTRVAKTSLFTGGAFAWFGVKLLARIITLFSLGIAYPFAVCYKLKWQAKHTYICGRRMCFDGNGAQLFGKYIIWWLLSVITFGIYYVLCAKVNMLKWETSHTHFEGEEGNSVFDGKWYQLYGVNMLSRFVTLITLSFGQFWAHCYKLRWECKHKTVDGCALEFNGTAMQYFGKCIVWILLTVLTFGIYSFWLAVKIKKWTISHTVIAEPVSVAELPSAETKEETKNF